MYVTVMISGGQGFLPDCCKGSQAKQAAFAQDIVDRYANTEYFDEEAMELYIVESWWWRFRHWLRAFPRQKLSMRWLRYERVE